MSTTRNRKILISGGGMAGCTLAYFLKQQGFIPVVVETAPEFKRVGYLLALNEQIGQKVAEKMDVLDALKKFEVQMTNNTMYDTEGRKLLHFTLDPATLNTRVGLMLNRADLHLTLYEKVKNDVEFRMGLEITALTETENGVLVTFSNGIEELFDIVIGADGIHSKVRKLVFGEGFENYMDNAYFAFTTQSIQVSNRLGRNEIKLIRGDGFTIAYLRLQNDEVSAYVFHQEKILEKIAPVDRRDYILKTYGQFDADFKLMIEGMKKDEYIFHDGFTQIVMPQWHKGRVCLIGDAAFCPTPASGVGASMAMAAAYIVAKKLSESDYQKAFADYDTYMRPYIKKAQSSASRMLLLAAGGSIISYKFTNFLLRLIPGGLVGRLHSHAINMPLP
ncbi:MAG: FAD-dependent monooxygenase [Parcubacteria group bacterium]